MSALVLPGVQTVVAPVYSAMGAVLVRGKMANPPTLINNPPPPSTGAGDPIKVFVNNVKAPATNPHYGFLLPGLY